MFGRHQQAKEYRKRAKETHRVIEVRNGLWFVRDEILSLPCSGAAATY